MSIPKDVVELLLNVNSKSSYQGKKYFLKGDLCQMATAKNVAICLGIRVYSDGGIPFVTSEEDFEQVKQYLISNQIEGWWNYVTHEEYREIKGETKMIKINLGIKNEILSLKINEEGKLELIKLPEIDFSRLSTITMENPIIPNDFEYVKGNIDTGFVIQDLSGNQFVWVPTNKLIGNGIGKYGKLSERFGRRNLDNNNLMTKFREPLTPELKAQIQSVEKHGGFYVSRYVMSEFEDCPKSVAGVEPWTNINFDEAVLQAAKMSRINNWDENISAHLTYATEYDSIMQWIIESKIKSFDEIVNDSTNIGNYIKGKNRRGKIELTGNPKFEILNICDLAGNVWIWTMEEHKGEYGDPEGIIRGGSFCDEGYYSANFRRSIKQKYSMTDLGFRVALYIK